MTEPVFVRSSSALDDVVGELLGCESYAIDTEFHRERTYFPRLALVQVAWSGGLALIDPLEVDLAPFAAVLDSDVLAVLHAADQDLEVLELACGDVPRRIFDTQIGAGFLGLGTPSLATVYERWCGVRLSKGPRMTDWLQRPLTEEQLDYASNDVRHLLAARDAIVSDLDQRGRTQWAIDECELLRTRRRGRRDPDEAWRRIKEARTLRGQSRSVARSLAAWRERRAADLDLPVRFVLSDIALVSVAQAAPRDRAGLESVRGVDRSMRDDVVNGLLAAVAEGLSSPVPPSDDAAPSPLERDLRPAAALISAWVSQLARDLAIDTALLATRADIEAFLRGDADARLAEGWRAELAGDPLRSLLAGEAAVAFAGGGELVIEQRSHRPLA